MVCADRHRDLGGQAPELDHALAGLDVGGVDRGPQLLEVRRRLAARDVAEHEEDAGEADVVEQAAEEGLLFVEGGVHRDETGDVRRGPAVEA